MAKNTNLSTIESKKQTKQIRRQRQNHGYGECFDGFQMMAGCRGMGEEVRGFEVQIGSYRIAMGM